LAPELSSRYCYLTRANGQARRLSYIVSVPTGARQTDYTWDAYATALCDVHAAFGEFEARLYIHAILSQEKRSK